MILQSLDKSKCGAKKELKVRFPSTANGVLSREDVSTDDPPVDSTDSGS